MTKQVRHLRPGDTFVDKRGERGQVVNVYHVDSQWYEVETTTGGVLVYHGSTEVELYHPDPLLS
jgi:hypothetical protein